MEEIILKFIQKLDTLPEEVRFFHSGNLSNDYISKLAEKYKVNHNEIYNAMIEIIASDFDFAVLDKHVFNIAEIEKLKTDIIGYLFLPIGKYLKNINIESEIRKRNGNISLYGDYINGLVDAIENENEKIVDNVVGYYNEIVNTKEEKETIFDLVGYDLVNLLKDETDAIDGINSVLLNLLFNKPNFKEEIDRVIFNNGEFLTHSHFEMEGKTQSPTIGNWIQDFISYNGSGMFSNLALTKYITESENAKRLSEDERKLVKKLLQLYRNIKFFPESLADVPVEEWEIIPISRERATIGQVKGGIGVPKTPEEKDIDGLKREEEEFGDDSLERLAIEEEINKKKKIESLKIEAGKYSLGSFERMAVEEEVRKLEVRS